MDEVKNYPPYLDYPKPYKPKTNADRVRAMSDEELAKYLYQMQKNILRYVATVIGYSEEFDFADEAPDLLEWLQQPSEEVDHEGCIG